MAKQYNMKKNIFAFSYLKSHRKLRVRLPKKSNIFFFFIILNLVRKTGYSQLTIGTIDL